ncbi:MAG TPA: hypothetical protein ENF58_02075 [Candidatus Altiarchaeales archaeon]|nr:hypothetical protein [Candidatus Altiarchaeales archaeon]
MKTNIIILLALICFTLPASAWWDSSYHYRRLINCSNIDDGIPIVINGSGGFDLGCGKQIVWTYCSGTGTALYYNNCSDYVVANDTTQLPMEVEMGNGTSYNPTQLWSDTVGVYHFGKNAQLEDSSPLNNDLTNYGATWMECGIGGCFDFDGTDDYLQSGGNIGIVGNTPRTVIWLVNHDTLPDGTAGSQQAYTCWGVSSSGQAFCSMVYKDTEYYFVGYGSAYDWDTPTSSVSSTWLMQVLTYNGTTLEWFVNATSIGTADRDLNTGDSQLTIGRRYDASEWFIDGKFSEVRIYNDTVLSDSEISQMYENYIGTAGYGNLGAEEISGLLIVSSPTEGSIYNTQTITISGTITKNANITYEFDNNGTIYMACINCSSFSNTSTLSDGSHNVTIIATNYNNASDTDSITINFTIDTILPTIQILSLQNNAEYTVNNILTLDATANEDISEWRYDLNGNGNVTFSPPMTITSLWGQNNLTVWAKDLAGNWNYSMITFTYSGDVWRDEFNTTDAISEKNNVYLLNSEAILNKTYRGFIEHIVISDSTTEEGGLRETREVLDINNDTFPDIIFNNITSCPCPLHWAENSGNLNSWTIHKASGYTELDNLTRFVKYEFNDKTGYYDILAIRYASGSFLDVVVINYTDPYDFSTWKVRNTGATGTWVGCGSTNSEHSGAVKDIDNDGDLDFYLSVRGNNITWVERDGENFITHLIKQGDYPIDVCSGDLTGDGDDCDVLILLDEGYGAEVRECPDNPASWSGEWELVWSDSSIGADPRSCAILDVDDDGDNDILIAEETTYNTVFLFFNNGTGGFENKTRILNVSWAHDLDIGDIDGDGKIDVLYGAGMTNKPTGTIGWLNRTDNPSVWDDNVVVSGSDYKEQYQAILKDMDNDYDLDFVFGFDTPDRIRVFEHKGSWKGNITSKLLTLPSGRSWDKFYAKSEGNVTFKILSSDNTVLKTCSRIEALNGCDISSISENQIRLSAEFRGSSVDSWNVTTTSTNQPPQISNLQFDQATIYTDTTPVNCSFTITDADNDVMNVTVYLYNSSNLIKQCSWTNQANGTTLNCGMTNTSEWVKGNALYCNVSVTDGTNTTTDSVSKIVSNTAPTITTPLTSVSVNSGSTWTYDYNATDPDVDDGVDTLTWSDNTTLFDINSATGEISDTPTEAEAGNYSIRITVSDGTATDTDDFIYEITVTTTTSTTSTITATTIIPIGGGTYTPPPLATTVGASPPSLFVNESGIKNITLQWMGDVGLCSINISTEISRYVELPDVYYGEYITPEVVVSPGENVVNLYIKAEEPAQGIIEFDCKSLTEEATIKIPVIIEPAPLNLTSEEIPSSSKFILPPAIVVILFLIGFYLIFSKGNEGEIYR